MKIRIQIKGTEDLADDVLDKMIFVFRRVAEEMNFKFLAENTIRNYTELEYVSK